MSLLLALAVATLTLTQCQMVGDRLNGVKVGLFNHRSDCVKECTQQRKDAMKAETDLHTSAVQACAGEQACLDAEQARHVAALDAIQDAFRACLDGCHNQGGGN